MDALYYISGTLMTVSFIGLIIALIVFLIKPQLYVKSLRRSGPVSRPKIFVVGLLAIVITVFGFSGVMAATEPESVKQERAAAKAAELAAERQAESARKETETQHAREEEAKKPVVKTETKTEIVPYQSTEQQDGSLAKGESRVSVAGKNGERTIWYEVTYIEGVESERKEVKREVTKAPVDKVTRIGTYEAPVYTAPATPAPQSQANVYYQNCSAARAAGAAPVYAGEPGYGRHLDRDNDGIGCE